MRYDNQGNLTAIVGRRGYRRAYAYNSLGQITRRTLTDEDTTEWSYDAGGNLLTVSNLQGVVRYEYDDFDRITSVTYPNGRFLVFEYDILGRRTRTADQSGFAVRYYYDTAGRLSSLEDDFGSAFVTYNYGLTGRLIREDRGNGSSVLYSYDTGGRVTLVENRKPDGTENSRFEYYYGSSGVLLGMSTPDGHWSYEHDATDQLTRAVFISTNSAVPDQDLRYTYDAAGNRMRTIMNGVTTEYKVNMMNQYTQVGATHYTYDEAGNLIQASGGQQEATYTYDARNRLIRVATAAGTWDYEYGVLGNRAASIHDGVRTEYVTDPNSMEWVVAEYDEGGALNKHYLTGFGLVGSVDSSGQTIYYDFDAEGATIGLTDSSGNYINRYVYDPYGRKVSSVEGVSNHFEFVGRYGVMKETHGLLWMRARYYDPDLGRFCAEDPLHLAAGDLNLYRYVENSPLTRTDSTGLAENKAGDSLAGVTCSNMGFDPDKGKTNWLPTVHWFIPKNDYRRKCVAAHEQVHVNQCKSGKWRLSTDCNGMEKEALEKELACIKKEKLAEKSAAGLIYEELTKLQLEAAKKGQYCKKKKPRSPAPKPGCPQRVEAGKPVALSRWQADHSRTHSPKIKRDFTRRPRNRLAGLPPGMVTDPVATVGPTVIREMVMPQAVPAIVPGLRGRWTPIRRSVRWGSVSRGMLIPTRRFLSALILRTIPTRRLRHSSSRSQTSWTGISTGRPLS